VKYQILKSHSTLIIQRNRVIIPEEVIELLQESITTSALCLPSKNVWPRAPDLRRLRGSRPVLAEPRYTKLPKSLEDNSNTLTGCPKPLAAVHPTPHSLEV